MLEKYLIPDKIFKNIYEVTPRFLCENGIKALISDIDNTLVTYDDAEPTPEIKKWFDEMEAAGIKIAFISNNDRERLETFNKNLGYFGIGKSKKPFGKSIRLAMKFMQTNESNTALVGDQLFTDIMAGKLAGLKASYLVPPIKDKLTLFFRIKRKLEKPYIKKYYKIHGEKR